MQEFMVAIERKASKKMKTKTKSKIRRVYLFGGGKAQGNASMKDVLGGKGANLAEMTNLGIAVPPGFTISTDECNAFYKNNKTISIDLKKDVLDAMESVEKIVGCKFGDPKNPLLVSVRSGAKASMPGMMDTVLNLGINDETVHGLIKQSDDHRFAYDSYRRFVKMYADVVMGMNAALLEAMFEDAKKDNGVENDADLDADELKKLVSRMKRKVYEIKGIKFPSDPHEQLFGAISAVFNSWNTPRAKTYRKINNIPDSWGTAVNVQAMVFGNLGDDCATGVAFTRDPSTGERLFFGEYLINAQGEDVVAGIRTPWQLSKVHDHGKSLEEKMPKIYKELVQTYKKLEKHYRDMQDIEFTVQNGKLWMLQARTGKRTAKAAVHIAVDMVKEGLITKKEALLRVQPSQLDQLLHPTLDPEASKNVLAKGLPASPGAASGRIVFNADDAETKKNGKDGVLLVRNETSPEDIHGMVAANGILTVTGGMTSHAAVVARGMGKPCIVGCSEARINEVTKTLYLNGKALKDGDLITIDGGTGEVIEGRVKTIDPSLDEAFITLMSWADRVRRLGVKANADTPKDAKLALDFGAEGIGLCRTEHMFFDTDRIDTVREMIIADDEEGRRKALDKILPMQREDFLKILEVMKGKPVTIRLLDPPLHEFLPQTEEEIEALARRLSVPAERLRQKLSQLKEFNPMLGHRGCRLGVAFPEIYDTQVRAIMEAACELKRKQITTYPEIMIPLVAHVNELLFFKDRVQNIVDEIQKEYVVRVDVKLGTMIELPRAAVTANEIAQVADFFSFGTNDLTQTTLGLSRDDAGRFLPMYVEKGIFLNDPFVSIDKQGVGKLIEIGTRLGREVKPSLDIGICGEHGGDPDSVALCHQLGLTYVSCSPFRVPIARLAAAQAALNTLDK
jgi:pyruvate, orthophosphate dikinase